MASSSVDLKIDEGDHIVFAHSPYKALIFTVFSLAFTLMCWFLIKDNEGARIGFTLFTLLFVFAGIAGIFWRMELDINLLRRKVRLTKGMWPSPKTSEIGLDDAEGVWLDLEYRSSGSKNQQKVPWWFVSLKLPSEKSKIKLVSCRDEVEGYKKWEYYAKRLQLDAVDATGEIEERKPWASLDKNLAMQNIEEQASTTPPPMLPPDSQITVVSHGGSKELIIPPVGFGGGLVFLVVFGGIFALIGSGALLATFGIIDVQVNGSEAAVKIVPTIFLLIGLGIISLGIVGSYSALVIGVDNGALFSQRLLFGRRGKRSSISLTDIESVRLAGDVRSRSRSAGRIKIGSLEVGKNQYRDRDTEVVVRSDQQVMRFGNLLRDKDKKWLASVCRYATVKGRLPV